MVRTQSLTSETVQGLALPLKGIDDIHGSHSLTTSVLRVGDRITNNVLKEYLEHSTSLLIDKTRDTLHTTTTSETTNSGLSNTLDIITKDLAMTLSATLSKTFTSFSSACKLIKNIPSVRHVTYYIAS